MKRILILILLVAPGIIIGQSQRSHLISVCLFNNSTKLPPASLTAAFKTPIHLGVSAAYEFGWKETAKQKWFQNAGISYWYHQFVNQVILLNSQAGYRWKIKDFSVEANIQVGYMHAFYLTERFVQNPDGTYMAKKGGGKSQFISGAGIGLGYDLGKDTHIRRIILNYDFRMQLPFVRGYVPLLPNGALGIGFQFNLKSRK